MSIGTKIVKAISDFTGWVPLGEGGTKSFLSMSNWFRSKVKQKDLILEYKNLVYACVKTLAEDTAQYEPFIYKEIVDGRPVPLKQPNDLIKLIQNPNAEMSQFEFIEGIQTYLDLTGQAFVYFILGKNTRQPKEVGAILRPDKVTVVIEGAKVIGYVYTADDGKQIPFEVDEIVHFKQFNPWDQSKGFGPTEAGKLYIDIENETSLFQWGVLKNQSSPAGIVSLKSKITQEAFAKLQEQWKEKYSGTDNAGKTLFLRESDATFTKVGLALSDLEITDMSKTNDEKIRKMFRMPRELLGDTSNSGLGRANIEAIEYLYAKRNIEPRFIRLDDQFTVMLRKYYGITDVRIGHVSMIPKDELAILNAYDKGVDRWLTRNEVRKEMNLPSVEGGNTLYTSFTNIPIGSQQEAVTPQTGEVQNGMHKHSVSCNHKSKVIEKAFSNFANTLDVIEETSTRVVSKGLNVLLKDQMKEVLEIVKRFHDKDKGVTADGYVDYDGTNFEMRFNEEAVETNMLKWLLNAFKLSGETTLEYLGKPDSEFLLNQARRDAIFRATERQLKSFNEQTALKLQQQIAQSLAKGESIEELQKRIESVYSDATGFRSKRIAESESHKVVNEASAEVYKDEGYTELEWVANPDACEFCSAMDGTIVPIGQPFIREGQTLTGESGAEYMNDYADVLFGDLHPNCKCRLRPRK